MDTISQFVLGSLTAELAVKSGSENRGRLPLWLLGGVAGTLPDLDVLIRSSEDALLATEYHRHFTHSIPFVPLGALLALLFFWPWIRREKDKLKYYYWAALWAFGTHWMLDSLTSYGTQIFRPFSDYRFSLDVLSIIDPLVTLPWILGLLLTVIWKNRKWGAIAMLWFFAYTGLCAVNQFKALQAQEAIASSRGHKVERGRALPTLANSFLFRSVYEFDGQLYADAILVRPWSSEFFLERGESVAKARIENLYQSVSLSEISEGNFESPSGGEGASRRPSARLQKDLQRWFWFVDHYAFIISENPLEIGDGRYTLSPNSWNTLWTLRIESFEPYRSQKANSMAVRSPQERNPLATFKTILNPESEMEICQYQQKLICQTPHPSQETAPRETGSIDQAPAQST